MEWVPARAAYSHSASVGSVPIRSGPSYRISVYLIGRRQAFWLLSLLQNSTA